MVDYSLTDKTVGFTQDISSGVIGGKNEKIKVLVK